MHLAHVVFLTLCHMPADSSPGMREFSVEFSMEKGGIGDPAP